MTTNRWMNQHILVYPYNESLLIKSSHQPVYWKNATTWRNLKYHPIQKCVYCIIPFIWNSRRDKPNLQWQKLVWPFFMTRGVWWLIERMGRRKLFRWWWWRSWPWWWLRGYIHLSKLIKSYMYHGSILLYVNDIPQTLGFQQSSQRFQREGPSSVCRLPREPLLLCSMNFPPPRFSPTFHSHTPAPPGCSSSL